MQKQFGENYRGPGEDRGNKTKTFILRILEALTR